MNRSHLKNRYPVRHPGESRDPGLQLSSEKGLKPGPRLSPGRRISISDIASKQEAKRILRKILIRERQSISLQDRLHWSGIIQNHLLKSTLLKKFDVVAVFIGFGSEVQTWELIRQLWRLGKSVVIPVSSKEFKNPNFVLLHKSEQLVKTQHGPLEPKNKRPPFRSKDIQLIIVPGLGFDRYGNRLGYGGGVYDRLLEKSPRAKRIGIFFSSQELPRIPREHFDRALHGWVTEKGVFEALDKPVN